MSRTAMRDYLVPYLKNFLLRRKLQLLRLNIDWEPLRTAGNLRVNWEAVGCHKVIFDDSVEVLASTGYAVFPLEGLPTQIQFCGYRKKISLSLDPYSVEFHSQVPPLLATTHPEIAFSGKRIISLQTKGSSLEGTRRVRIDAIRLNVAPARLKPFCKEDYADIQMSKRARSKKIRRG